MPGRPPDKIIISAYAKSKVIEEAINRDWASIFISKPWDPTDLKVKMDALLLESYKESNE